MRFELNNQAPRDKHQTNSNLQFLNNHTPHLFENWILKFGYCLYVVSWVLVFFFGNSSLISADPVQLSDGKIIESNIVNEENKHYLSEGIKLDAAKRYRDAARQFQKIIQSEPEAAVVYFLLGQEYSQLKEYDLALKYQLLAAAKGLDTPEVYYETGRCYYQFKLDRKAKEYFEKALYKGLPESQELLELLEELKQRLKFFSMNPSSEKEK